MPRNVRLALAAIDMVEPWVEAWPEASGPLRVRQCVPLRWRVWGAVAVDESAAVWRSGASGTWEEASLSLGELPPAGGKEQLELHAGRLKGGAGVWGDGSSALQPAALSGCAMLPESATGRVQLAVRVRSDSMWTLRPQGLPSRREQPSTSRLAARLRVACWHPCGNGNPALYFILYTLHPCGNGQRLPCWRRPLLPLTVGAASSPPAAFRLAVPTTHGSAVTGLPPPSALPLVVVCIIHIMYNTYNPPRCRSSQTLWREPLPVLQPQRTRHPVFTHPSRSRVD